MHTIIIKLGYDERINTETVLFAFQKRENVISYTIVGSHKYR